MLTKNLKKEKNQNKLRSEDIDKISFVYHNKLVLDKYSKLIHKDAIAKEDYNCNIRRYVDNSPSPIANDVHAHLKGGIPLEEVNALNINFGSYEGLKKSMFLPLKKGYEQFVPDIDGKEKIKEFIDNSKGKEKALKKYTDKVNEFWVNVLPKIESLPTDKQVYDFTKHCTEAFSTTLADIPNPLLSEFQIRGSFAQYIEDLKYDFKSVAASAWKAELIPDDEILESQFPEVLANYRKAIARRDELEALFETVNELEDSEWNEDDYEAIPKKIITEIKSQIKANTKEKTILEKELAKITKQVNAYEKDLNSKNPDAEKVKKANKEIALLNIQSTEISNNKTPFEEAILFDEEKIKKHVALETELKKCRDEVRDLERVKATLVDEARAKITPEEAKKLIIDRWLRTLHILLLGYQENHTRNLIASIEELFDKYVVTLDEVLSSRETETHLLNKFLIELGYE